MSQEKPSEISGVYKRFLGKVKGGEVKVFHHNALRNSEGSWQKFERVDLRWAVQKTGCEESGKIIAELMQVTQSNLYMRCFLIAFLKDPLHGLAGELFRAASVFFFSHLR